MTDLNAFQPDWVSHPGESIADLLDEKGWTQQELAERMGFTRKHVNELITGKASLSPEAALKLEAVLGGSARFWLAREAQFQEARVRSTRERALEDRVDWLKLLPLKDMIHFRWLKKMASPGAQIAEAMSFFGVASIKAWEEKYQKPLCAFRASSKPEKNTGSIAAWLRQGERQADRISCQPFSESGFRASLKIIRRLTLERDPKKFLPKLVVLGAENGVAIVLVPIPTGCPVSGATRWLSSDRALLQLSVRYKTDDHLWFTMFHEAGHLLLHGRAMFLEGAGVISDEHEREADAFARDMLIPSSYAITLRTIRHTGEAVSVFAQEVGISPGVVVGRMQKEGLLPWTHLNGLKTRFRWVNEEE